MKQIIGIITILCCVSVNAQNTTYTYPGWGKPGMAVFKPLDSLKNTNYTQITYSSEKPVLLEHYDGDQVLQDYVENEYDKYGNHISQRAYDGNGQRREETLYKNDPTEMALFRTVFGPTFIPANSNFIIQREYNQFGRETAYYIIGVQGETICSRIITYREDKRKELEILRDDLNDVLLIERRYKYIDAENRTILEEFNGAGKMVQRVVLFDHHDIIEQ